MRKILHHIIYYTKLSWKLYITYIIISVIPFIIFSICLLYFTNRQLQNSVQQSFQTSFYTCCTDFQKKADKIETSMKIISLDHTISTILNTQYENSYDKYQNITGYFDSLVNTVCITLPEISNITFYTNDSLAGIRQNFLSIEILEEKKQAADLQFDDANVQWFFEDGAFYAYALIYGTDSSPSFSIMEVQIPQTKLVDPAIFQTISFNIELRGNSIISSNDIPNGYTHSAELFNGLGHITGYAAKPAFINGKIFLVLGGITCSTILLLLIMKKTANSFTKRFESLNFALSTVIEKNFSIMLPENYHDELGDLSITINRIIQDIRKYIQNVYESRIKEQELEMKALQAQINPHFLYNTLSAINWYALETDNIQISEMVLALSKFYRTALNQGENVTTVQKELENIRAYIQIQQYIHSNSFDVEYEIDERVYSFPMPNLIIQPIVENALEHGIDLKTDGRGKIVIRAALEKDSILLEVTDNGVGIPEEKRRDLLTNHSKSYGLWNVCKRLQLFYGEKEKDLIQYSSSSCGTVFQIHLHKL